MTHGVRKAQNFWHLFLKNVQIQPPAAVFDVYRLNKKIPQTGVINAQTQLFAHLCAAFHVGEIHRLHGFDELRLIMSVNDWRDIGDAQAGNQIRICDRKHHGRLAPHRMPHHITGRANMRDDIF